MQEKDDLGNQSEVCCFCAKYVSLSPVFDNHIQGIIVKHMYILDYFPTICISA